MCFTQGQHTVSIPLPTLPHHRQHHVGVWVLGTGNRCAKHIPSAAFGLTVLIFTQN
jgi:hypothetical protein